MCIDLGVCLISPEGTLQVILLGEGPLRLLEPQRLPSRDLFTSLSLFFHFLSFLDDTCLELLYYLLTGVKGKQGGNLCYQFIILSLAVSQIYCRISFCLIYKLRFLEC